MATTTTDGFTAALHIHTIDEHPGLTRVCFQWVIDEAREDYDELTESLSTRFELYQWAVLLTVTLASGEVRQVWSTGSHDDSDLVDNLPRAELLVPTFDGVAPLVRADG